jgi:hypothetical protein
VELFVADALKHDFSDGDIFYFYTPMVGKDLQLVLNKLYGISKTRNILIVFEGPEREIINNQPWLTLHDFGNCHYYESITLKLEQIKEFEKEIVGGLKNEQIL